MTVEVQRAPKHKKAILATVAAGLTLLVLAFLIVGFSVLMDFLHPVPERPSGAARLVAWDPLLGYIPAPDSSLPNRVNPNGLTDSLYTDSRGARVNHPGEQTPGKVDIVVVGGSFARGPGVENEETFAQLLGNELGMTVANFAMGGYGTLLSLLTLERNLDLSPKYIVYAYIGDHARRNHSPCAATGLPFCIPQAYMAFDDGVLSIHPAHEEYRQRNLIKAYRSARSSLERLLWRGKLSVLSDLYYLKTNVPYPRDDRSYKRSMDYLIGRMLEDARKVDAQLMVVGLPILERFKEKKKVPENLLRAVRKYSGPDLIFVNLFWSAWNYYKDKTAPLLQFENDGHPSTQGHRFIADGIAKALRAHVEAD